MGVSGLLPLLKSIQKPSHLREFAGLTVGVDAYGWLHRGAVPCAIDLALGKPTTKYVEFSMHRVRMLYHFGVTPYIVFDGDHLPSKALTEQARAERRREARRAGEELMRAGKVSQAHQEFQKAVDITPEMARQLIEELQRFKVKYVVAPYEADSQLAYLEKQGLIDAIISEDSDLLVFGAKTLLTKLDQYGECIMIKQDDFTACRDINMVGWTSTEFRRMAILSGCDYLDGIPKLGLKSAYRLVRRHKTIERIIQLAQLEGKFRVPPGYLTAFDQAEKTFLHQWVFCPNQRALVNLTPLEKSVKLSDLPYIGEYTDLATAQGVADGSLNPMTKDPIKVAAQRRKYPQRTSPLKPKLGKENTVRALTDKKLEDFFRPSRVPLAELDPNCLTPSPRQQELLRNNENRAWSSQPATSPWPTIGPDSNFNSNESFYARRTQSATQINPLKRQRLSGDRHTIYGTEDCQSEERSKFFISPKPKRLNNAGKISKKSRASDFYIHSDDSMVEALLSITPNSNGTTPTPINMAESSSSNPKRYSEAAMGQESNPGLITGALKDFESGAVGQTRVSSNAAAKHTSISCEQHETYIETNEATEKGDSRKLAASTLLEIEALRSKYSYETPSNAAAAIDKQSDEVQPATLLAEPTTPPISSKARRLRSNHSPSASVVHETPRDTGDGRRLAQKESSEINEHVDEKQAIEPSAETSRTPVTSLKLKGSEDLFVVPDSDEGSEEGSPCSASHSGSHTLSRRRRVLDFSQYAFTPHTSFA